MVEHDGAEQAADPTPGHVVEGPTLHLGAAGTRVCKRKWC
ncbi:hypothetical protein RCH21_000917 [Arthrobacter sp. PL16]|nr:hypothetical protein [Arthrobacter sp. PL16]